MIGASKREYAFRNNVWQGYFHEFIGIKWCQNKSSVWTFIILEEIWFQYFFSHLRVLDKKLCHREICLIEVFSFLQFAKGLLREKIIPPSHSRPCMAFPQLLPPDCAMEESSHFDTNF